MPAPTITDLSEIHRISDSMLVRWRREGVDIYDSRAVVTRIWNSRRKAPEWQDTFTKLTKGDEAGTHEAARKLKTEREAERLRLINARLAGDSFDRADGEAVMASWISALNLGLQELQGTLPAQLEGLTAAELSSFLDDAFHQLRANLSDLSSELWENVYRSATENSPS